MITLKHQCRGGIATHFFPDIFQAREENYKLENPLLATHLSKQKKKVQGTGRGEGSHSQTASPTITPADNNIPIPPSSRATPWSSRRTNARPEVLTKTIYVLPDLLSQGSVPPVTRNSKPKSCHAMPCRAVHANHDVVCA
ncbi:hypothetical protein VTJ04DRAFT_5566 [Mycothermus thermophilus]|uniref:uncharacterized protein n=1 Tax=Humicola insolens TaxID=85995 RepID=UPI0037421AEA